MPYGRLLSTDGEIVSDKPPSNHDSIEYAIWVRENRGYGKRKDRTPPPPPPPPPDLPTKTDPETWRGGTTSAATQQPTYTYKSRPSIFDWLERVFFDLTLLAISVVIAIAIASAAIIVGFMGRDALRPDVIAIGIICAIIHGGAFMANIDSGGRELDGHEVNVSLVVGGVIGVVVVLFTMMAT